MSLLNTEMSFGGMTKFLFVPKARFYNCPLGSSLSEGLETEWIESGKLISFGV